MSAGSRIHSFRRRATAFGVALSTMRGLLRAVPCVAVLVTLAAVVDRMVVLPAVAREIYFYAAMVIGVAALVSGFFPLGWRRPGPQSRFLSRRSKGAGASFREDDLRVAVELDADGANGSAELRDAFVTSVSERLRLARPWWCFPPQPWKKMFVAALTSTFVAVGLGAFVPGVGASFLRVLDPFVSASVERLVKITPGDARVPEGSDVEVRLEPIGEATAVPELLIRAASGWDTAVPDADGRVRVYHLKNVLQPISYRVRLHGESSRRFDIQPITRVRITAVTVRLTPPAYTGKAAATVSSPEIAALSGSEAEVTADASVDLRSASVLFSDGREKAAVLAGPRKLSVSFGVAASGTYHFRLTDAAGDVTETEAYPVIATADAAPEIRLLSPTESIAIGEREKLPLTFDVRDDVALAEVRVEWESPRGKGSLSAIRFNEKRDGGIMTYDWDLAASGLVAGDRLRYRLAAIDANTVTGPGIGRTDWLGLEIASFEREHDAVSQALSSWRDKTVDLLAQLNTLNSKLEKGADKPESLSNEFNQSAQLSERLEQALSAIVSKMEEDPLADMGVLTEHQAIAEGFKTMNKTMVPSARGALNTGNKEAAESTIDAMASEIERMTSLSEDLTKRQNARDVVDRGDALEKLGQDLLEKLDNANGKDPAMNAELQKILQEAQKNLQELAKAIQKNPGELPEDFVNQQGLKNLKLGSAQDMLSKISAAVKAGDMKGAMQMAQDFLKATQNLRKKLSEANDAYTDSGAMSDLEKKIAEQQKKLAETVDKQRALLAGTQALDTTRLERAMKEQDGAFAKLAERQRGVIGLLRNTLPALSASSNGLMLATQSGPMLEVLGELEKHRVTRSFDLLAGVVPPLRSLSDEVSRSTPTVAAGQSIAKMADEESAILNELKRLRDFRTPPPAEERGKYDALHQSQDALAKSTQELRQQFQALSRKTAMLGLPLTEALNRAAGEMKNAGSRLGDSDSRAALSNEQSALAALQDAASSLSDAQDAMSSMSGSGKGSPGGAPRIIARPSGSGGQKGSKSSPVRFPKAEDYRPPREFREDLMESLKENYPKIYEDIIHRYYRRLAD